MKDEHLQKIIDLRHELHRIPELSMQEKETAAAIRHFLRENTSFQIIDRGSWFYAVKKGRQDSKRIAFRADMDALPIPEEYVLPYSSCHKGISHRCGHDGHCAALCGLAMELSEREVGPSVYLIFQPAEETGQGALLCRDLIGEEGIQEIYAFHNLSGYPKGSIVYHTGLTQPASEGLEITFSGRTSHASSPEDGSNPAELIAEIILRTRELTEGRAADDLLCTVTGIQLGSGDFGISPGEGQLYLTLRAREEADMKELERDLLTYAKSVGERLGIQIHPAVHDYFPETRNHNRSLERVVRAAEDLGFPLVSMDRLFRASEDFGWYLKECSGAIFYIGNGTEYPGLHTVGYDFNDQILKTAVDMFLRLCC